MKKIAALVLFSISTVCLGQDANEIVEKGLNSLRNYDMSEAEKLFSETILIDSTIAEAYLYRGESREYSKPELAKKDFLKAIELDSSLVKAYHYLHRYFINVSNKSEARYYLEKAVSFDPNNSNNLLLVAQQLRWEGNLDLALDYCNKSIKAYKNQGEFLSHVERAEIKFELGDYKGCVEDFETCFYDLTMGMYTAGQFEKCGDAHAKLGQMEKACEKWNYAISHMDIVEPSETARKKIQENCN